MSDRGQLSGPRPPLRGASPDGIGSRPPLRGPMPATVPALTSALAPRPAASPKGRPDAKPMRLALGAGFLAALSALAGSIVAPPQPTIAQAAPDPVLAGVSAGASPGAVVRPVVYVQLQPGQTAPPGAKVIDAAAPTPLTVVTVIPGPAQKAAIVKTTQSGKVVP